MNMTDKELMHKMNKAYYSLAWRIFVYLKANPDVLNYDRNKTIFLNVRKISIRYRRKRNPEYSLQDISDFVDSLSDLEAKKSGDKYFVEQEIMDFYRPNYEHTENDTMHLFVILLFYESGIYTKEIHRAVDEKDSLKQ